MFEHILNSMIQQTLAEYSVYLSNSSLLPSSLPLCLRTTATFLAHLVSGFLLARVCFLFLCPAFRLHLAGCRFVLPGFVFKTLDF